MYNMSLFYLLLSLSDTMLYSDMSYSSDDSNVNTLDVTRNTEDDAITESPYSIKFMLKFIGTPNVTCSLSIMRYYL